jgi:hypothetical protein
VRWRHCAFHALARLTVAGGTTSGLLHRLAGEAQPPAGCLVLMGALANTGYLLGDTARTALYGAGSASWRVTRAGSLSLQRLGRAIVRLARSPRWEQACAAASAPVA